MFVKTFWLPRLCSILDVDLLKDVNRNIFAGTRSTLRKHRPRVCAIFRFLPVRLGSGLNTDRAHHAFVFMFEDVAVIDESSYKIRIAKIHAPTNAGISERVSVEIWNIYGIAKEIFMNRNARVVK